jgi:quercetin dioxygenase-like cupin family protein
VEVVAKLDSPPVLFHEHLYASGEVMAVHKHTTWQILIVLSGCLIMWDGQVLNPGDSLRIPAGVTHGYIADVPTRIWSVWGNKEAGTTYGP